MMPNDSTTLQLEPSTGQKPVSDSRPRIEVPPPCRLVSVDDVRLPTPLGLRERLLAFYSQIVQLMPESELVFRAENFRLRFEERAEQPVVRETVRPLGIEVPVLADVQRRLVEAEIEYIREIGITPGRRALLVQDPAGNWLELFDSISIG